LAASLWDAVQAPSLPPFTSPSLANFVNSFLAFSPYLGDVSVDTGGAKVAGKRF
jgi:hypothetical protein